MPKYIKKLTEKKENRKQNIWQCWRCGKCCRLFVFTGVELHQNESWKIANRIANDKYLSKFILPQNQTHLPTAENKPPKRCIFLKNNNICVIHTFRPIKCQEYPIMIKESKHHITLYISTDCPRGERISEIIKRKIPKFLRKKVRNKKVKIISTSFYEHSISNYFAEED